MFLTPSTSIFFATLSIAQFTSVLQEIFIQKHTQMEAKTEKSDKMACFQLSNREI
jgi:hypothetical protein